MALNLPSTFELLQQKLKELKEQELYYAGELVFASMDHPWKKIDLNTFYLQDVPHGDKLDRIVMLFTNQAVTETAMLVIEKSNVFCTGVQNRLFPVEAFRSMQCSTGFLVVGSGEFGEIIHPLRLIYDKPLFLTLLYQHNLLRKDINLQTIACGESSAEQNKDLAFYKEVRETLRGFFGEDIFRQDFPRISNPFDSTELVGVLAKYLDGLRCMQQILWDRNCEETESNGATAWKRRCREIENIIVLLKKELSKLEDVSMLEVPYPAPEVTIALWRCEECFLRDLSFGELISIRTKLEQMLGKLRSSRPDKENAQRNKLREYRMDILLRQLREVDSMLEEKTQDLQFDWSRYLWNL